ncbi:hypothetical protein TetV_625 [Tetraselmis virus 1]|uniref:Uncharacterized protein n=1 Tax=Tetraselmis virus 1 TaxID=2060617 RepID=A0A2P0VP83_9VIRU|nr:hypothetical protein QJ968_gp429 [Tetraselmis virus 1]AUF82707.1 hypothetical protein TetV_625 [Tetraselmis virus 1]
MSLRLVLHFKIGKAVKRHSKKSKIRKKIVMIQLKRITTTNNRQKFTFRI